MSFIRDLFIEGPSRWEQTGIFTPVIDVLTLPATVSESVCSYAADHTVNLLSYSSYLVPSFINNFYHSLCQRRAHTILTHVKPYLQQHPGLRSLLFSAQAYQENPTGLRKIVIYARALFHWIASAFSWFYSSDVSDSYDEQTERLANRVISRLVCASDTHGVKLIARYALSYFYQAVISESVIHHLCPTLHSYFSQADRIALTLTWALRAYVYVPFVYKLYQGYTYYRQLPSPSIELATEQLNLPHPLPGFINRPLRQFHALVASQLPFLT